jgi:hypothetical protein
MHIFEQLYRTSGGQLQALTTYAKHEVLSSPLFEALFDCNIIWKSKYYEYFCVEHYMYVSCIKDWVDQRKNAMNSYEKCLYYLYKKKQTKNLGSSFRGVSKRDLRHTTESRALKLSPEWELGELYFNFSEEDRI